MIGGQVGQVGLEREGLVVLRRSGMVLGGEVRKGKRGGQTNSAEWESAGEPPELEVSHGYTV
jgi:hypothetical protein